MNSTSNLSRTLVMAIAFAATFLSNAQAQSEIFISDGANDCTAALLNLQVNTASGNVTATVDSLADCSGPATPAITSFTVNGSASGVTVDEGVPVTVSWNSSNTTGCISGGSLPNWANQSGLATSGNVQVATSGLSNGNFSLTLSCTSSQGTIAAGNNPLTVQIQNSSSTSACASRPPPPNMTRAQQINFDDSSANAFFFAEVFNGAFPGSSNSIRIRVPSTQYVAMEFTTGNHPPGAVGEMQIVPVNLNNTGTNSRIWSVSQCPGDFRPFLIDAEMGPGCVFGPSQGGFRFGGTNFQANSGVCALEPNTTYFMNFFYTDDAIPSTEQAHNQLNVDCPETFCGDAMKASGVGF